MASNNTNDKEVIDPREAYPSWDFCVECGRNTEDGFCACGLDKDGVWSPERPAGCPSMEEL